MACLRGKDSIAELCRKEGLLRAFRHSAASPADMIVLQSISWQPFATMRWSVTGMSPDPKTNYLRQCTKYRKFEIEVGYSFEETDTGKSTLFPFPTAGCVGARIIHRNSQGISLINRAYFSHLKLVQGY
jgi:hypothetical protein